MSQHILTFYDHEIPENIRQRLLERWSQEGQIIRGYIVGGFVKEAKENEGTEFEKTYPLEVVEGEKEIDDWFIIQGADYHEEVFVRAY